MFGNKPSSLIQPTKEEREKEEKEREEKTSETTLVSYVKQGDFSEAEKYISSLNSLPGVLLKATADGDIEYHNSLLNNICNFLDKINFITACEGLNFLHAAVAKRQYKLAEKILTIAVKKQQAGNLFTQTSENKHTAYSLLMYNAAWRVRTFTDALIQTESLIFQYFSMSGFCGPLPLANIFTALVDISRVSENTSSRSVSGLTEVKNEKLVALVKARSEYDELLEICKLARNIDNLPEMKANKEYKLCLEIYEKYLEEYTSFSYIHLYPGYNFGPVKRMYLKFRAAHPELTDMINRFLDYINKKELETSQEYNHCHFYKDEQLTLLDQELTDRYIANGGFLPILELLSSTLAEAILHGARRPNKNYGGNAPALPFENEKCAQVFARIKENTQCLREADDEFSATAAALDAFRLDCQQDIKTNEITKIEVCNYFNDITNQLISGKLKQFPNLEKITHDLMIRLIDLPPMSPHLKAAICGLIGAVVGLTIGCSMGTVVPLFLLASTTLGGLTSFSAGFFNGRKEEKQYQERYHEKIQPLQIAILKLTKC